MVGAVRAMGFSDVRIFACLPTLARCTAPSGLAYGIGGTESGFCCKANDRSVLVQNELLCVTFELWCQSL